MVRELRDGWAAFVEHTWLWVIVVVSGIVYAAICAVTLLSRSVRDLEHAETPAAQPAPQGA